MYFITAFNQIYIDGQTKTLDVGFQRTFGYYDNFNYADEALKQNYCDMHEAIYHYAVIEKINTGIHPIAEKRWFYKYDKEKEGFYPMKIWKREMYFISLQIMTKMRNVYI